MSKYKNKYKIESNRMTGWDYSHNGYYFITIVTKNRIKWFGEIINGKMIYSDFGKIVLKEWGKSFQIRTELFSNEFILMPDHLHAILILNNKELKNHIPENHGLTSQYDNNQSDKFQRKPKSISSFMAGFKSATINRIDDFIDENNLDLSKFNRHNKLWQDNYHDHIIRNKIEFHNIKNYIINNPKKWWDNHNKRD